MNRHPNEPEAPPDLPDEVCVLGVWHLGSVTSACLADLGYRVVGVDPDAERVDALMRGEPPLFEPGLAELMQRNIEAGRLRFVGNVRAVGPIHVAIVAFDTPVDDHDQVDLTELSAAVFELAAQLSEGALVIVSSQVPVGTCAKLATAIREARPSLTFGMAYVPENLRLGQAIERFLHPEMLVMGGDSPDTLERVDQFFGRIDAPRVPCDLATAEMTKHAINSYLATAISFSNEVANLADAVGADALTVVRALRLDSRVSPKAPLMPGLGFSGGTLARDLQILRHLAKENGTQAPLIEAVLTVNERQTDMVVARLRQAFGNLTGVAICVLGLTYKAGTSTLRRSAAIEIIRSLATEGALVTAYDPMAAGDELRTHRSLFSTHDDPYVAAEGVDAVVVVTGWPEFRELDFSRIRQNMRGSLLVDTQNFLDGDSIALAGFRYLGAGRSRDPQRSDIASGSHA